MWTIYGFLVPAITALFAGFGGYFGTYLKKKGENLATKEDIGVLTQITKEIEAKISDQVWNRQRQWELKRDILLEATKRLARAHQSISMWAGILTLSEEHPKTDWDEDRETAIKRWGEADKDLAESIALASVVSGQRTIEVFNKMNSHLHELHIKVHKRDSSHVAGFVELNNLVDEARDAVRRELEIPIAATHQSSESSAAPTPD